MYLADTHLVVFYRCPPQFKIFEADFGLPQHDELFEAVDPLDSERIVSQIRDRPKPMSLKSILRLLMDDSPVQMEEILLQTNSLFSLFLIMSGALLHPMTRVVVFTNDSRSASIYLV